MMKFIKTGFISLFVLLCALSSCTDNKNPAQQYGNTLTQSLKKAKDADNKANIQQVQKSIQEFYAANGRYPSDLGEVSAFNGIELKHDNFNYDPATGSLTDKQ
jgi:hypothetical protein